MCMLSELSHRHADRHQFPYGHKSQLHPKATKLGGSILLCSDALFSWTTANTPDTFTVAHSTLLYPTCTHPLISVLFALTIPSATCPSLHWAAFDLNFYLPLCPSLPPGCVSATCDILSFMPVPRMCISVTSGARSQWVFLSSGGCLAHWE